ncbi:MAG: hypothetical protein ABFC88_12990 [Thermoguttaceae bacterium]
MPKICYVKKNFREDTLAIIAKANRVIDAYMKQGFKLTLRQLYYQFIAKDLLPDSWIDPEYNLEHGLPADTKNTMKNYKHLGDIINDARLAGLIDWTAIEDRTRNLQTHSAWENPYDIVRACANQFTVNLWDQQSVHVEVWIEKEALIGVIENVCTELQVPFFACKGYTSQSEMWEAAQRLKRFERDGLETVVIHLGDHDPSGKDMTRDIEERLNLFGSSVTIDRIALTWEQIEEYSPPPNPAKTTDARYAKYQEEFGDDSWELDALEPQIMADLIREAVERRIDQDCWQQALERRDSGREQLTLVAGKWDDVLEYLDTDE